MVMDHLTSDQQSTYSQLLEFGFTSSQATHASLRYGSNVQGALNWVMDNPDFNFNQTPPPPLPLPPPPQARPTTPTDDLPPPPLVTATGQEQEEEEDLPHPDNLLPPPPPPGYEESLSSSLIFGPKEYHEKQQQGSGGGGGGGGGEEKVLNLPHHPHPTAATTYCTANNNRTVVDIDLTKEEEITDLQKAIQLSTTTNNNAADNEEDDDEINKALALSMVSLNSADLNQHQEVPQTEEDLEQLLIDQISTSILPKDRIRSTTTTTESGGIPVPVPVVLRSLSPHMSSLSSYLQCLFSNKIWRLTILSWREPIPSTTTTTNLEEEEEEDFEGLWKGESFNLDLGSNDYVIIGLRSDELQESILRLKSLQRLFSCMLLTNRSFLHIQEVVQSFRLKDFQFHGTNSGIETIRWIHKTLIQDLKSTSTSNDIMDFDSLFTLRGKRIPANSEGETQSPSSYSTTSPIDQKEEEEQDSSSSSSSSSSNLVSTDCLDLPLNPASTSSNRTETFSERLDHVLLENTITTTSTSTSRGGEAGVEEKEEFHLLIQPCPKTLLISLNRKTELTCLPENFGGGTKGSSRSSSRTTIVGGSSSSVNNERNLFKIEKEFWLDRYDLKNFSKIKESRIRLKFLENEIERVEAELNRLGRKGGKKDGENVLEILKGTLNYLDERLEEEEEEGRLKEGIDGVGDSEMKQQEEEEEEEEGKQKEDVTVAARREERKSRQKRLKENYQTIYSTLSTKLNKLCSELNDLKNSINFLFSDEKEWKVLSGPYKLTCYLFRTGLNGRGSNYSLTFDQQSQKWFKIRDLEIIQVEDLNKELEDRTGLFLDGGIQLVFYELDDDSIKVDFRKEQDLISDNLKRGILRDNHSFAKELLQSHHQTQTQTQEEENPFSQIIKSWNLPTLQEEEKEKEVIPIIPPPPEGDTVENINLSPVPPESSKVVQQEEKMVDTPMSVDLVDGVQDDDDDEELEPLIPPPPPTSSEGEGEVLRLRGGGGVGDANSDSEEEEEEEYSDEDEEEGLDEDEVELGLLEPMPISKEGEGEWDIDYKVGKIGGKPIWLDPNSPLKKKHVECGICGKTMKMLCQVNSPDDSKEWAAARSLYVFACRGQNCLSKDFEKALKVWRIQMPSPNEFFPHTSETIKKRKQLESQLDPETGLAKDDQNDSSTKRSSSSTPCWPEWDIVAEPEPYQESYLPDDSAPSPEQGQGDGEDADAPDTISGVDKEFLAFQERIEREPRQVLRFYRLPDVENPQPLWTSSKKIDSSTQVPPCELCKGPREIEFQILSTLLSHLEDDNLDFDSLLVYTCLDNCKIPPSSREEDGKAKTGWAKEVIFKQDFTNSGVKFGFK